MTAPGSNEYVEPGDRVGLPKAWTFEARGGMETWRFDERVRPWNWPELGASDALAVWNLLEEFVEFFNARYVERNEQRIPPCWAEHGCLVEEITTLSFARWHAFASEHATIGGTQYWHQYSVPGFLERLGRWLGPDRLERCQQGKHEDARDSEPASELEEKRRRHSVMELDGEERERQAAAMTPADRESRDDLTPRIAFLERQRARALQHRGEDGGGG